MTTHARFAVPAKLPNLVEQYVSETVHPVRFRLPSWESALAHVPGRPTWLLSDRAITTESADQRFRSLGDRVVAREAVIDACTSLNFADDEAVISAFVLVMAWGSGTSNSRSLRNTKKALQDVTAAAATLRRSAAALCEVERVDDPVIADVHRRFSLPGVGEAFFSKWFAFAGFVPGRAWQPLILDARVRATLHRTLDIWLNHLTDAHNDADRYNAYLTALHRWAPDLPRPVTAARLEWIMFAHNGRAL